MDINYHRNNYFLYPHTLLRKRLEEDGVWAGWQPAKKEPTLAGLFFGTRK